MKRPLLLFSLIASVQLAIPVWMIVRYERVVQSGTLHLFRTAPVDPRDPFRGEYVTLEFAAENGPFQLPPGWDGGPLFAVLNADAEGFAVIDRLLVEAPADVDHVQVTAERWGVDEEQHTVSSVVLPFDRYYVHEGHGPRTEALMRNLPMQDGMEENEPSLPTHAVVRVHRGRAVMVDLVIGGRPLRDWMGEEAQ